MNRKYKATNGTFSYYKAEVMTANDYYPFGMTEPQRGFEAETQTCHYDTIHETKYALNDTFSLSWDLLNSGWSSIGTSVISFLTDNDMKITQAVPITLTSPLTFGAKKSFVSGVGTHTVSFSLKENTCNYINYTNIIIPHNNVSPTTVNIKNSQGTIVATQNYTSAGFYSFPFSASSAGNYTIEFTTKTNYACRIEVDDVKISYESTKIDTVCSGGARANNYRFGFGSHEKIDEIHKANEWYAFGDYGYDPRVVQRPRTDPEAASTPSWSPYRAFKDNPIIYTDLFGNTEFYYKSKWIGSDGQNNGMIGVVDSRSVAKGVKKGIFPNANEIRNGAKTDGLFVIHNSILKSSVDVLNQSLTKKGENREFGEKLKKTPDGNYESMGGIKEGPAVDLDKGERGNVPLPTGGDVSIHSHLTGITEGGNYTDAKKPSPEDKVGMNNEEMSIIVGVGGDPKKVTYTDEQGNNVTETHDIRDPKGTVEFFDKSHKDKSSYSLNGYDASKISKDYQGKRK